MSPERLWDWFSLKTFLFLCFLLLYPNLGTVNVSDFTAVRVQGAYLWNLSRQPFTFYLEGGGEYEVTWVGKLNMS